MLIMSWNVAGLSTTVKRVHQNYGHQKSNDQQQQQKKKPLSSAPSPLASFFADRHHATIICLQEHKIPRPQLEHGHEPERCSQLAGYESFWACDTRPNKGLNGVVTYAPVGSVRSANAHALGCQELDEQGRCILTDHGTFCLFNVYVPAMGGQPLSYKMKFLQALRRAMQQQRLAGKRVVLVGDLNIAAAASDWHWKNRVVHVQDVLEQVAAAAREGQQQLLPLWKRQVAQHWQTIETVLGTAQVVETKTTNSLTGEQYNKFRLAVTITDDEKQRRIFLGQHQTSADYCTYGYDFSECYYEDEETQQQELARQKNVVQISILAELLQKIVGVSWDEAMQQSIVNELGEAAAPRLSPSRRWLHDVLEQDGMVDVFRHFYPTAQGRFTCWDQSTNQRYVNKGKRIDYTLVDRSLLPMVEKGSISLRCGDGGCNHDSSLHGASAAGPVVPPAPPPQSVDPMSDRAAFLAATARGKFQPVSFEGGGITEATQDALDTQFGPPHTGMIYTPPSFSDHIAVSLLMKDSILPTNLTLENDSFTKKAQPHKLQRSILSFLTTQPPPPAKKPKDGSTAAKSKTNTATAAATRSGSHSAAKPKRSFFSSSSTTQQKKNSTTASRKRLKPAPSKGVQKKNSAKNSSKSSTKNTNMSILRHFRPKNES